MLNGLSTGCFVRHSTGKKRSMYLKRSVMRFFFLGASATHDDKRERYVRVESDKNSGRLLVSYNIHVPGDNAEK